MDFQRSALSRVILAKYLDARLSFASVQYHCNSILLPLLKQRQETMAYSVLSRVLVAIGLTLSS